MGRWRATPDDGFVDVCHVVAMTWSTGFPFSTQSTSASSMSCCASTKPGTEYVSFPSAAASVNVAGVSKQYISFLCKLGEYEEGGFHARLRRIWMGHVNAPGYTKS